MSEVLFRRATVNDVPVLHTLCRQHAAFEQVQINWTDHDVRLRHLLVDPKEPLVVFIAQSESRAVGFVSVTRELSTWNAALYLHMDCLFVVAEYRNKGVGRQLMAHVTALARHEGISEIQWQTPKWNLDATRFYESIGASQTLKRRFFLHPSL